MQWRKQPEVEGMVKQKKRFALWPVLTIDGYYCWLEFVLYTKELRRNLPNGKQLTWVDLGVRRCKK